MAEGTTNVKMQGSVERLYKPLVLSYLQLFCVHLGSHQACLRCPWHVTSSSNLRTSYIHSKVLMLNMFTTGQQACCCCSNLLTAANRSKIMGPDLYGLCLVSSPAGSLRESFIHSSFINFKVVGVCVHMQVKKKKNFTSFLVHVPAARPYCNSA